MGTYRDCVKRKGDKIGMGLQYSMCIIMGGSKIAQLVGQRDFEPPHFYAHKLCDYYSPIPILSPFLFTPSLYDFSFAYKRVILS